MRSVREANKLLQKLLPPEGLPPPPPPPPPPLPPPLPSPLPSDLVMKSSKAARSSEPSCPKPYGVRVGSCNANSKAAKSGPNDRGVLAGGAEGNGTDLPGTKASRSPGERLPLPLRLSASACAAAASASRRPCSTCQGRLCKYGLYGSKGGVTFGFAGMFPCGPIQSPAPYAVRLAPNIGPEVRVARISSSANAAFAAFAFSLNGKSGSSKTISLPP